MSWHSFKNVKAGYGFSRTSETLKHKTTGNAKCRRGGQWCIHKQHRRREDMQNAEANKTRAASCSPNGKCTWSQRLRLRASAENRLPPRAKDMLKTTYPREQKGNGSIWPLGTNSQILNCGFTLRTAGNFSVLLVVFSDDLWKEHCVLLGSCVKHHRFLIGPPKGTTPSCFVGWWKNSSYHILWIGSQQINCSEYCNQKKKRKKEKTLWSPKFDSKTSVKKMTTHLALTGPQDLKTDKEFPCSVSRLCVLLYRASSLCIQLFFFQLLKKKKKKSFPTLS